MQLRCTYFLLVLVSRANRYLSFSFGVCKWNNDIFRCLLRWRMIHAKSCKLGTFKTTVAHFHPCFNVPNFPAANCSFVQTITMQLFCFHAQWREQRLDNSSVQPTSVSRSSDPLSTTGRAIYAVIQFIPNFPTSSKRASQRFPEKRTK